MGWAAFCLLEIHKETWLKTAFKGTDVFEFECGAAAQGASHLSPGLAPITRALLSPAVKPCCWYSEQMVICMALVGSSWNLVFYKMDDVQLRNWFSVMFTALEIVFSCTFCILKPFIGVQCSLHKYKGKKPAIQAPQLQCWNNKRWQVNSLLEICLSVPLHRAGVEPLTVCQRKGTWAFKKSIWLGTFILQRRG